MINQSNDEKIRNTLLHARQISLVLYVLSETPSYDAELKKALKLSSNEIKNCMRFLKNNSLIRELKINDKSNNGVVKAFYPILLQKQKKAVKGLSPKQAIEVLKRINYYFISPRGLDFLPYARKKIFQKGGEKHE